MKYIYAGWNFPQRLMITSKDNIINIQKYQYIIGMGDTDDT